MPESPIPTPFKDPGKFDWGPSDLYYLIPESVRYVLFSGTLGDFNVATVAVVVGVVVLARNLLSILGVLRNIYFRRPTDYVKKYKAGTGAWAVVTGASAGIGREFALQLADKGFNVFIMARREDRLNELADEIKEKHADLEVEVHPFDFVDATHEDYDDLAKAFEPKEITILVNNVGINQPFPQAFADEHPDLLTNIVHVNCTAQVRITRLIFPQMVASHRGLVLNIGSVAGLFPNAFLSVYSGTKAFLRNWSRALCMEGEAMGVEVQHCKTYYVSTAMSKMKPNHLAPMPREYVRSVLRTAGQYEDEAPFPMHMWFAWAIDHVIPEGALIVKAYELNVGIRERALKRKARLEREREEREKEVKGE
ncbi:hypothetical protein HDV00_010349 [Rhizophlyctis rosea]|nr:hypothetical protein HDV00_010349 [Rhizophlyctis rosea]